MFEVIFMLILFLWSTKLADFITECGFRYVGEAYDGAQIFETLTETKCNVSFHGVKIIGGQ